MKGAWCLGLVLVLACEASAITIDGNLSDWGVTPFSDLQSDLGNSLNHSGVYDPQSMMWGDEHRYDIEFGAIHANNSGVHIAMILSDPNVWEDLSININGSNNYQFGVDLTGINAANGVQQRGVYEVNEWQTSIHGYTFVSNPFQILEGDFLGTASFAFASLGAIEANDFGYGQTFGIEGYIPWALLGISPANSVGFHFAEISCLRDAIKVSTTTVPEPATCTLVGAALAAVSRKRKRHQKLS